MSKKQGAGMPAGQDIPAKQEDVLDDSASGAPEPKKKPPPPKVDEGDKTKCPACGVEFSSPG